MAEYEEDSLLPASAVERLPTGELMSRVELARRFPRDIKVFQKKLEGMALSSVEVAQSTFYKLRRKKKDGTVQIIEGPSIRFMELVAPAYQHLRWMGKMVSVEEDCVVSQSYCHDMENDLEVGVEVRRPIKTSSGGRYSGDMINVTAMAGVAIAMRNALGKVVPRPLWEPIFLKCKDKAIGGSRPIAQRRQQAIEQFGKMGVSQDEVLAYLDKEKVEQITADDLETLLGTFTAIKDEGVSIDETFGRTKPGMDMPQSNAEAGVAPTPGGPLEAALGKATGSPAASVPAGEPEIRDRDRAPEAQSPVASKAPAGGTLPPKQANPIPQDRKTLLERINKALASYPSAEVTKVWQNHIGKADPNVAQIGRLQGMFIALGLNKG